MPQHRGQGIYKAMYAHVKDMAREQQVSQVRLYVDKGNTRAQEVYKKLGMDECHYLMYEEVI
jgi:ribosomal protein S18 acetylase RimI-like enzyme